MRLCETWAVIPYQEKLSGRFVPCVNGASGMLCSASSLQELQHGLESSRAPPAPACPKRVAAAVLGVQWDWCRADGARGQRAWWQGPARVPEELRLRSWVLVEMQIQSLSCALRLIWAEIKRCAWQE